MSKKCSFTIFYFDMGAFVMARFLLVWLGPPTLSMRVYDAYYKSGAYGHKKVLCLC